MVAEAESQALTAALGAWPKRVSSSLLATEAVRASRRIGEPEARRAEELLVGVSLVPITDALLRAAAWISEPTIRSLDALHLATLSAMSNEVGVVFSYDSRLSEAVRACGVTVESPA